MNHIILYKNVPIFCQISDESALIRNFLCNGRLRGRLIGRVRVNIGPLNICILFFYFNKKDPLLVALNMLNFTYEIIFTVTFWIYLVHHLQPPFGCQRQFSPFSNFRSNKPNLGLWQKSTPNNEEAIEGLEQAGSKRLRTWSQKYPRSLGLCDFGDHKSPEHYIVQRAYLNSSGSYSSDSEMKSFSDVPANPIINTTRDLKEILIFPRCSDCA